MQGKRLKFWVLAAMMAVTGTTFAQRASVVGVVADSVSREGEPYASVRVFSAKSPEHPVAMGVTDINGHFKQEVKGAGEYRLTVTSIGKKLIERRFSIANSNSVDLDSLLLTDEAQSLKEVVVTAQRPLVKMEVDKMTYSVDADVDAKTNSVLDMLRKVPMVTVDGNDNITVNGSSNFKIYVDGKPNVMLSSNPSQILKSMPASVVKDIEVITNPGAKYDAEGVGGVLNFVMDKSGAAKGATDNFTATARAMASATDIHGGVYAAMQKGKLSMSVNANIGRSKMKDTENETVNDQISSAGVSSNHTLYDGSTTFKMRMANLSAGYEIDSLRLLSASVGLMGFEMDNDMAGTNVLSGVAYGKGYGYGGTYYNRGSHNSFTGSIDYQRGFAGNKNRMLTLSYLFTTSPNTTKTDNGFILDSISPMFNLTDRYINARTGTIEHTFQADFTNPMGKVLTLDAGLKYIYRKNTSHSDYYNVAADGTRSWDEASSINYRNNNDIFAAYAELGAKSAHWSGKAGLRYEYTWQNVKYILGNGQNFSNDYGNLVPSGNVSYAISQSQNIGLAYNMRISRPGITMLNPYVDRSNPTALTYGNTNLDAEKAHNISLVYNYFTPKWVVNMTLRESLCDNAISRYSFYQDNLLNTTYGNITKNHQTSLNAFINWTAGKNTRLMLNGGVNYTDLRSDARALHNYGWQANGMVGLQQTLPWNIRLSVNAFTSTKTYLLDGWSTGFNMGMMSLSRSFLSDKLNVSIMAVTPIDHSKLIMKEYKAGSDYSSMSRTSVGIRKVMLSISYTIGGNTSVKKAKRSINNDDVHNVQNQQESLGKVVPN
jgi:outer membrane receptor protein involved in Fe transport